MGKSIHVAALDLGSSAIKAMVARKDENGVLSILASEQIKSDNCIRRGYIFNSEETTNKVSQLIESLNKKLDSPIEKIYVGVGGQSLRSERYSIKREVTEGSVTAELLDSLAEEIREIKIGDMKTVGVTALEYYLDGQPEQNPQGATCSEIELRFQLLLVRSALYSNLFSTIEFKVKLDMIELPSPLATAEAVLNDREKELGCALVEFGAGITYVSIYNGGLLRYLATIPLGGSTITRDIRSLKILEAEEVKLRFSETDEEENVKEAIDARRDEILANVIQQIKTSGYEQSIANIVITGGGAQLKNLSENLRKKSGKDVRLAYVKRELIDQSSDFDRDPANSCVIGLLALGTEECLKEIEVVEEIPVAVPGETDLFGEPIAKSETKKAQKEQKKERKKESKSSGIFVKIVDSLTDSLFRDEK